MYEDVCVDMCRYIYGIYPALDICCGDVGSGQWAEDRQHGGTLGAAAAGRTFSGVTCMLQLQHCPQGGTWPLVTLANTRTIKCPK